MSITSIDLSEMPPTSSSRVEGFKSVLNGMVGKTNPIIVEIGVSRKTTDLGDGNSTMIFNWFISKYGGSYHGCDISAESLKVASSILSNFHRDGSKAENVALYQKDGADFIRLFNERIDLLYLDGWDWYPPRDPDSSAFHGRCILFALDKLANGAVVLIDDVMDTTTYLGKGELVIPFLLSRSDFKLLHSGYQFAFQKTQ